MLKRLLSLLVILLLPVSINAVIVNDLYEAEVPVSDQSGASQKKGLEKAMLSVLVKLTGDRNIQGRPVTEHLLKDPEKYLQQYKYHNKPVIENNQLTLKQELHLRVSFNESALNRVLRDYSVPIWGRVRPSVLVWVTVEDDRGRRYIGLEDESGFTNTMDAGARSRGIALTYPLLDSEDRNALQVTDVRSGFVEPIRQASARYSSDSILAGHLEKTGDTWKASWTSIIAENVNTWTVTGDSETVLQAGINTMADTLADRYIQTSTFAQESGIEVVVNDINTYDDYARVLKYLRSLNSVIRAEVRALSPGQVTYSLTSTGGEAAVRQAIELGKTLESLTGNGSPYRLVQKLP